MTAPTEPTPGAPAPAPAPPAVPTPPAAPPAAPPTATPAEDLASLPEWAQKTIRDARAEAGKARTDAKAAAAEEARRDMAAQVARALGIVSDEPPSPQQLTEQIERAQAQAWWAGVELQVHRFAPEVADSLLDSRAFIESLDDLVDLGPTSTEFRTALQAKVQEAAAKYPTKTGGQASPGPRPDPSQGSRGAQTARPTSLTQAFQAHYKR